MEHLKTYYSLEKHLEETVKFNPQFEILNAIWKLNKKNLSSALNNVSQYFPHYSLHDQSHSNTIINNIELFLGEDRIKNLSPTNTWLLLMATFTHDLGMVVFQELIEQEWSSSNFQDFLLELCESGDENMSESGKLLMRFQNISNDNKEWDSNISPIKIKNSVTLVVAEYMRKIHHQRSSDILKGIDKTFNEVASAFYSDQIPNRLLNLLGDIAFLHGVEFYEIFKRLDFESNGISNDRINPRFIAAMLRLGDLLDIDDGRFNVFTTNVFKLPASSIMHKKKHSSIKHFLITPEAIEITADCPEEQVYRLARTWFDWLESEVESLNKEWSNIAPGDLTGSAPRIPKGKIRVYFNGSRADEDLLNLKFHVSNQKIFEILEGGSIYEKAEFAFIRELVQNALDASKIQLWSEIEKGVFDFVFKDHFNNQDLTHGQIINKIIFPDDIPEQLQKSFQVNLIVKWENDQRENLVIEVSDTGTGISDLDLIRMTSKVGESRKGNKGYVELIDRMPFWLKPTGAFGIGLQSLFIIVDSFKVFTKSEGEEGKVITFRSSKKGKYSTVINDSSILNRGTRVQILISQSKFTEVFGNSFAWDIIANYDPFTDEFGNIYIHKIREYIQTVLFRIENLNIYFFDKKLSAQTNKSEENTFKVISTQKNETAVCNIRFTANRLFFQFFENQIGSEFILEFFVDDLVTKIDNLTNYKAKFYVRDIPVNYNVIHYTVLPFCKLYWNFMSQSSDKILSITREKFLTNRIKNIEYEFQNEVLNKVLPLIVTYLEDKGNQTRLEALFEEIPDNLNLIYFKIILTLKVNRIKYNNFNQRWVATKLQKFICDHVDGELVSIDEFLQAESFLVPIANKIDHINDDLIFKQQIIEKLENKPAKQLIIWKPSFFQSFLRLSYYISEIRYYEEGLILKLEKGQNSESGVKIKEGYNFYLNAFSRGKYLSERAWNYASSKYFARLAVLNEYKSGFENFPYLSSTSIISPFKNDNQIGQILNDFKWQQDIGIESIKLGLTDEFLKKYVTEELVQWILNNNPNEVGTRNVQDIFNGYRDLISELLLDKLNQKP